MDFINCSLAGMVHDMTEINHDFPILRKSGLYKTDEQRRLLLRKGIFPYEHLTSLEKFSKETKLPARESFFSTLTGEGVSEEDYLHGQKVFTAFKMETMLDYLLLYNKSDVYLLLDGIRLFRNVMFEEFKIDPLFYISLPQFAFEAMLLSTGVELGLVTDYNQLLFLESAVRGGVSYSSLRYGEETSDVKLRLLDATNLYGSACTKSLPVGNYQWCDRGDIKNIDWAKYDENGKTGYFLEVDFDYPSKLFKKHRSFPLAPETLEIHGHFLSPRSKQYLDKSTGKRDAWKTYKSKKLVGTFLPKKKYVLHASILKYYLSEGLKLTKIHRVLKFDQSPFVKDYIHKTALIRANHSCGFIKSCIKLTANSIYGKTLTDVRKFTNIKLVQNSSAFQKAVSSPFFQSFKYYSSTLVACFMRPSLLHMGNPISIGLSILDYSKQIMYDFYYSHILPASGNSDNIDVILSDTDSFLLWIKTPSINNWMRRIEPIMDHSNLTVSDPLFSVKNKGKLGYLKNETGSAEIEAVCSVRSKCYSLKMKGIAKSTNKCKGCSKKVVKNILFSEYKSAIFDSISVIRNVVGIASKDHRVSTVSVKKTLFAGFDDKRAISVCGVHSQPYTIPMLRGVHETVCNMCEGEKKRNKR